MAGRTINARDIARDIKAGMSDAELMEKYKISAKGLESLFSKLAKAGLMTESEISGRSRKISRQAVPGIRGPQPPPGPGDPPPGIDAGIENVIMDEIKQGVHENEIMRRHELSPSRFRKIVATLTEQGHLPENELTSRKAGVGSRCPHCSARIAEGAERCGSCGRPTGQAAASPPPHTVPPVIERMLAEEPDEDQECPWEDRESYGLFKAYFQTAIKCLSTPPLFFSKLPISGGYGDPILFAVFSVALSAPIGMLLISLLGAVPLSTGLFGMLMGFVCALVGAAVVTPVAILIWSGIVHGALLLLQAADGGFQATLRVVSYSAVTQLFNALPYVGNVASLYGIVLTIIGLRETHRTTTGRAVAAVLTPLAVGVAFALILYLAFK